MMALTRSQPQLSRLDLMQAQFQQRQLLEKEKRLLEVLEAQRLQQERTSQRLGAGQQLQLQRRAGPGGSAGSSTSSAESSSSTVSLPAGKVRQLFEGRRAQQQGWDKSRPLPPVPVRPHHRTVAAGGGAGGGESRPVGRSLSNQNLSKSYHYGQRAPEHSRLVRGRSLDRWQAAQIHRSWWQGEEEEDGVASDESDDESSPPPYVDDLLEPAGAGAGTGVGLAPDLLGRLPNVGGPSLAQELQESQRFRTYKMAPPSRLSGPANGTAAAPARRPPPTNENAPPRRLNAAAAAAAAANADGKAPVKKPTGLPRPTVGTTPLRPSSGQRTASTPPSPSGPGAISKLSAPSAPRVGLGFGAPKSASAPRPPPPSTHTGTTGSHSSHEPASNGVGNGTVKARLPFRKNGSPPSLPVAGSTAAARMSGKRPTAGAGQGQGQGQGAQGSADDGLAPCSICGRRFAPDRIATHQTICSKTVQKKRKTFDPVVARVKGTEAEKYLKVAKNAPPPKASKQSNWRRKHEDFIATIRAAKQVQSHLASGGKLSDLPPPPPSDYSDYVQCPHCGRKFNQTAADRHIPKCATMLHNKPKPVAGGSQKGAASKPQGRPSQVGGGRR